MSFDIASLLSSTPRSSRIRYRRSLKYPFPTCKLVWHALPKSQRWFVTHRSTPTSTPPRYYTTASPRCLLRRKSTRRCLEGQFQKGLPAHDIIWRPGVHMIACDASGCQEAQDIRVTESFLGRLTEVVMNDFPNLCVHHRIVRMSEEAVGWLEVTSPAILLHSVLGPCDTVRLLLSQHGLYMTQVLFPFIHCIAQGLIQTEGEFRSALSLILPNSGYVLCPGIPVDKYEDCFAVLRHHTKGVQVLQHPVKRYEAETCMRWHKPSNLRNPVGHCLHDVCTNCKKVYYAVIQQAERTCQVDESTKSARASCTSNYSWSRLSPASQAKRHSQLVRERREFARKADEIFRWTGIPLIDEQEEELATLINTIDLSKAGESTLDAILLEAEKSGEGRGQVLRSVWSAEKEKASFFKDQTKNKTGSRGNRWSLITYRLALAIYSRSPSAFEAVKHLGILQLPSTTSLQAFISLHQRAPGANEQQMALQHELYDQHVEKTKAEGKMPPKREGILIFDEVKVQGKVIWNSKNNQILGLAMASQDLSSLHDIFCVLDEEEKIQKTNYILQFVWRDVTSKFDIVGPYYTSQNGFDANFTMACVHDAMFLLAAYNFNVLALIGDGASWNLTLFKNLCGHKGKFGSSTSSAMSEHDVPASFINPYTGITVWCIICPSHELKSLVSALYHSGEGKTKHFFKGGSFFGWKSLVRLWERELSRAENGQMSVVPRMKASYIYRDSWTRLSVTPAKIFQQEKVIAELTTHIQMVQQSATCKYDSATLEYLKAIRKIFECGLLSHDKVTDGDATPLSSISEGLQYFKEWCDEAEEHGVDVKADTQTVFIAWQTWDLLRLTVKGFLGFCQDFLMRNPGYYIQPVRINGSVVESLFSRFKYHANGNLSSVNYRGCVAKMIISDAVKGGETYRTSSVDLHGILTKKKRKRK